MKILIYIIFFIIGTYFGSFILFAVNNIISKKNKKDNVVCKNCNHKLSVIDVIPVLSYIFLKGKCRYCGKKIDFKYFFIETLMGVISIGIYISINGIGITLSTILLIEYLFIMIFITTLFIIACIDKKNKKIYKPIIFVGSLIGFIHLIYLYVSNTINLISIYRYILLFGIICIISIITYKKIFFQYKYILEILMICIYINMFEEYEVFLINTVLTMFFLVVNIIIKKRKIKIDNSDILAEKDVKLDIPIAYWLCISSIIAILIHGIII